MSASNYQFRLALAQIIKQGLNSNQPSHRSLVWVTQHFEPNQSLPQFDDVNVTVLNFPQLSRFQFLQSSRFPKLHISKDTIPLELVSKKSITFL